MPAFHSGRGVGIPLEGGTPPATALRTLGWNGDPNSGPQFQNWHYMFWTDPALRNLYNPTFKSLATLQEAGLKSAIQGSKQAWIFLNEPDIGNQANCTPDDAIAALKQLLAWNPRLRWMGPNVSLHHEHGWGWLDRFMRLLRASRLPFPEAWSVHHHELPHIDATQYYIWQAFDDWWGEVLGWMQTNNCSRPVIMTEVSAGRYWPAVHEALLRHLHKRAGEQSGEFALFQGYFWFSSWYQHGASDLLNGNGRPTSIGKVFGAL